MTSRWDFEWGQQGRASARANKIDFVEVMDALNSPDRLEVLVEADVALFVVGLAGSGRVVFVICDRVRHTIINEIVYARLASERETQIWQERR